MTAHTPTGAGSSSTARQLARRGEATVGETERVSAAWELLARSRTRHLPVMRGRTCVGILDDKALVRGRTLGTASDLRRAVGDLTRHELITVSADAPLEEVAAALLADPEGAIAVVDDDDGFIGIVTVVEILGLLAFDLLHPASPPPAGR